MDVKGKEAGQPIWRLLGGNDRKVLPYASGGLYAAGQTPEALGREFAGYIERGFRGVKIKIGGAPLALDFRSDPLGSQRRGSLIFAFGKQGIGRVVALDARLRSWTDASSRAASQCPSSPACSAK